MIALILASAVGIIVHIPTDASGFTDARSRCVRMLGTLGAVHEHPGRGWWFASPHRLVAEPVDHLELHADPQRALRLLNTLLPQMRRDLKQTATLAELDGGWYLQSASTRTVRISVLTGSARVQRAVESAMSVAGGGASAEPVGSALRIWSSVAPAKARALRQTLRKMGLSSVAERSTFDMYP